MIDDATLRTSLELAVRAPSLHNVQPWQWRVGDRAICLHLDRGRALPATDPDNRELIISCGAALHHLVVALAGMGWSSRIQRLPDPAEPGYLARVEPSPYTPTPADVELAAAIARRRTDRRRFTSWPVPAELIGQLRELAVLEGLTLRPITDPDQRWRVCRAIAQAADRQAADPDQVAELAQWSGRGPSALDGVPSANIPPARRVPGQPPLREFARPAMTEPARHGEPETAALLLVSTPTDTPLQWLRTGELTSAVLLTATRDGLGASPLTQPLEVADTRAYLGARVAGTGAEHPQILLRIGWAPPGAPALPPTPRRPLAEVVTMGGSTEVADGTDTRSQGSSAMAPEPS